MKKIVFSMVFVMISFLLFSQGALFVNQHKDSVVRLDPRVQQFDFVPGEILVRFQDEANIANFKQAGIAQTGLGSVDQIFQKFQVSENDRLFPNEKPLKSKVMLKAFNGDEFEQPSLHNIYKLKIQEKQRIFEAIEELKQDPNVIYAEPNYILSITNDKPVSPVLQEYELSTPSFSIFNSQFSIPPSASPAPNAPSPATPNDPLYSQQWYIPAVHADEVWDTVTNDSTQVIAILDTGIDWLHPDLTNKIWINPGEIAGNGIDDDGNGKVDDIRGWDWINNDNNPTDDNSHGTHVAGIAAAQQNNGIGIAGVSKKARIMALKVFQSSGKGDAATISLGINYAKAQGAMVLNMSFGSYSRSMTMEAALASSYASCILVAAAGNDKLAIGVDISPFPPEYPFFPAALGFVLGTQVPTEWSNYDQDGPTYSGYSDLWNYEMKAPGTNILSTIPNGGYRVYQGTSMAAPVLAGSLAMFRSLFPGMSQELMWAKLIQTTTTYFNIHAAIQCNPVPQLWFISRTIVDTLADGDNDGRVDAGETIQIWFKLRNSGGQADSVHVGIRFAEFEDTTTAQIQVSQAYLGSMSSYATLTNQWVPLKIHISENVVHDRDICFIATSWTAGSNDTIYQNIILTVENGEELSGVLDSTLTLTAEKLWLVSNSFRIGTDGHLIIKPGTKVIIYPSKPIMVKGDIQAYGTPDSNIVIRGNGQNVNDGILTQDFGFSNRVSNFNFVSFENIYEPLRGSTFNVSHCIFKECRRLWLLGEFTHNICKLNGPPGDCNTAKSMFNNFEDAYTGYQLGPGRMFLYFTQGGSKNKYNNFINLGGGVIPGDSLDENYQFNNFIRPGKEIFRANVQVSSDFQFCKNQYWGTTLDTKIEKSKYDFLDNPAYPKIIHIPLLNSPSDSAHCIVWKILVNGKDAQDEVPDPVGVGPQRFDIYFNKPMDTVYVPEITFGVRIPYTQKTVNDSGYWSVDHKIYTCFETVQLYTGDGINRVRVSGARDLDNWEIPVEDQRFEFVIQAAGSSSLEFMAQAGIGKVYLEWNNAGIPDLLGFNMYRFKNITDTTYTTPVMINSTLITDTTYTDFAVTPGEHYWYYYKVVNTDFRESDSSNVVNATPYNAPMGDANGDSLVNVLDITALISYMLNQDPQPFLFDAADVNNDNIINILDVIGVVDIIIGKKKDITSTIPPAYIYLEDGFILLKTTQPVAGLQFELEGEDLDKLELSIKIPGFELATCLIKGKLLGVMYSYSNKVLPLGLQNIIQISGIKGPLRWGDLLAGDPHGNPVKVIPDKLNTYPLDECNLAVYPNPFTQSTHIQYRLFEKSQVVIGLYDLFGKLVTTIFSGAQTQGEFVQTWDGFTPGNGKKTAGIYIIRFTANGESGKTVKKHAKVVMIK